jgi:hypothetical protein
MKSKLQERLEAMRLELARQNEQWEQAKELAVGMNHLVPIPTELIAEMDHVCNVTVSPTSGNPNNGAIRA